MKRGVFYNSEASQCSIHASGKMCFAALSRSSAYTLTYTEGREIDADSDFIIVNHHFVTNAWMTREIVAAYGKPVFCIVTEVALRGNPIEGIPDYFSHYIVLDPTIEETGRIHGFGRPLPDIAIQPSAPSIPTIGMFGFATLGKQWTRLIETVNGEFSTAIVRLNIPQATYVPSHMHAATLAEITEASRRVKPGIEVRVTTTYHSDEDLIRWCADNTINCFFYMRDHLFRSGLAAVTDQAIASGAPLLVTTDTTFRHIHRYIPAFPTIGIRDAIQQTRAGVLRMREDWSAAAFQSKFETILQALDK